MANPIERKSRISGPLPRLPAGPPLPPGYPTLPAPLRASWVPLAGSPERGRFVPPGYVVPGEGIKNTGENSASCQWIPPAIPLRVPGRDARPAPATLA